MYPDLSYVFHDLFGTAPDNWTSVVKMFGLWLAFGILVASYFLSLELKRREQEGSLKPVKVIKNGKTTEFWPHEKVGDITLVAAISGIIGAKLFAIFESAETIQAFFRDPINTLFSGSGLAIYGGLIVAFFAVTWYVRRLGIGILDICDATAPALIIGYGVGRMGCQLSGDGDWGIPAKMPKPDWFIFPDWLWSQKYPRNVLNEGELIPDCVGKYCHELSVGVYPTPLYEVAMALLIFAILWSLRKRLVVPGQIFFLYCIFNGVERFFIEKIRVNDKLHLFGMDVTQAEIISVLFILIGIIGLTLVSTRGKAGEKSARS